MSRLTTFAIICLLIFPASFIGNIVRTINCDWKPTWKEEAIHVIGIVIPLVSIITVWYGTEPNKQ